MDDVRVCVLIGIEKPSLPAGILKCAPTRDAYNEVLAVLHLKKLTAFLPLFLLALSFFQAFSFLWMYGISMDIYIYYHGIVM